MKLKLACLCLAIGVVGGLLFLISHLKRENTLINRLIHQQRASASKGFKISWKEFLLDKARHNQLPKTYRLLWNHKGSELRKPFGFPKKPSTLSWETYRKYKKQNKGVQQRLFLQKALAIRNSWDRILALKEWKEVFKTIPQHAHGYEETVVNPEAKAAYLLIFKQFSKRKDFSRVGKVFTYDDVLFRVLPDGSIESFVPSLGHLRKEILPSFLEKHTITLFTIGPDPWSVHFISQFKFKGAYGTLEYVFITLLCFVFIAGIFLLLSHNREHKIKLLQRVTFLNQVVHELKTPLAGLKIHLQLLQKGQQTKTTLP